MKPIVPQVAESNCTQNPDQTSTRSNPQISTCPIIERESVLRIPTKVRREVVLSILLLLIVGIAPAQSNTDPAERNAHLEDVVAALFSQARIESGTQPFRRIYRTDVEKLVCTAVVRDASHAPAPLPLQALYKTAEPDKLSEALQKLVSYQKTGFRRFAVAVWTAQPRTEPAQYWIGIRLYVGSTSEFLAITSRTVSFTETDGRLQLCLSVGGFLPSRNGQR